MKINQNMARLLAEFEISKTETFPETEPPPALVLKDGSVFLGDQYAASKNVSLADFPDRTGFESFVNHVHLPFGRDKTSLLHALGYAVAVQKALEASEPSRRFLVIVSVSGNRCTVRFHQCYPNESWLADNLENYEDEAILVLST